MNLYKRGMIFVTFLGSCLSIALLAAAMGTKYWVVSKAKRTPNPMESDGIVHFGLFQGEKELNVAYGWRTYSFTGTVCMKDNQPIHCSRHVQQLSTGQSDWPTGLRDSKT